MNITVIDKDGERHEVRGKVGDNLLYLAHRYGIEMEGQSMYWSSSLKDNGGQSLLAKDILQYIVLTRGLARQLKRYEYILRALCHSLFRALPSVW